MPINEDAANFLKYAFTETKDLAMHFLTVITAVLVFSLAFAEKIGNYREGNWASRAPLSVAWCSFLLAILSCGVAICYVALAGGVASANSTPEEYWAPMDVAIKWMVSGGMLFVLGLLGLIITALRSAFRSAQS
jgi:hypothetical protein